MTQNAKKLNELENSNPLSSPKVKRLMMELSRPAILLPTVRIAAVLKPHSEEAFIKF